MLTGTARFSATKAAMSGCTPPVSTPPTMADPTEALALASQVNAACHAKSPALRRLEAAQAAIVSRLNVAHRVRTVLDTAAAPDRGHTTAGHRRRRTAVGPPDEGDLPRPPGRRPRGPGLRHRLKPDVRPRPHGRVDLVPRLRASGPFAMRA